MSGNVIPLLSGRLTVSNECLLKLIASVLYSQFRKNSLLNRTSFSEHQ